MPRISSYLLTLLLLLIPSLGVAQTPVPDFNSGFTPYQTYHGGDIDSVNMATGSLNLHIPLISFPQKGSGLRLTFAINYNSTTVARTLIGRGANSYYQWSASDTNYPSIMIFDDQIYSLYENRACSHPPCNVGTQTYYYFYAVTGPDGAEHVMGYTSGSPTQTGAPVSLRSMDMMGFYLTMPDASKGAAGNYTIYDESGNHYNYGTTASGTGPMGVYGYINGSRTDSNGNSIATSSGIYIDTIGRTIPAPPPVSSSTNNTDTSGCTGPLGITKAVLWQVPGYNGQQNPIKFCYATLTISVEDGASGQNGLDDGFGWATPVIQSIVLPDAQTLSFSSGTTVWEFEYNDQDNNGCNNVQLTGPCQFGTLSKVTLPTGGSISYTYQMYGDDNTSGNGKQLQRAVRTRTVSDGTTSNTWTYTYTTPTSSTNWVGNTVVTAPKLPYDSQANDTVHTVSETWSGHFDTVFVNQIDYYQGSHSSGTHLKSVVKAFTFYGNPYYQVISGQELGIGSNKAGQLLNSETTTLLNAKVLQATYAYDPGFTVNDLTGSVCCTFYYGLKTNATASDYGAAPNPGPVLRQTGTNYEWQANSSYLTPNLLDRVSSVTALDGAGKQFAQTSYGYDENNGSPQGILGNLTSGTHWSNIGSSPKTQTVYNSQGMPTQKIDANGNTTTITYDSSGLFPSQIQSPTTSGITHIDKFSYDFNTGLLNSHTDQNGNKTSYLYDAMRRGTRANYPDGGQITNCFTDAGGSGCSQTGPPYQLVTTRLAAPSPSITSTTNFDGLGRAVTLITSDPNCSTGDRTDTTYDALGHTYTLSNPYCTTSDSTYGKTTYAYDGLGRACVVAPPDGTVPSSSCSTTRPTNDILTVYSADTTTVTDQAGKSRRSITDGLGRLTQVVEDPAGLGYVTNYSNDSLNNLIGVLQNGSRQRSFTYDSLSRLVCASNPETSSAACPTTPTGTYTPGTTGYAYDANGNLLSKTAPAPNQNPPSPTVTTSYTYDPLNRLTNKTYSDPNTPPVWFYYDQSSAWGPITNPIGRLTTMYTGASTGAQYSYDSVGRVVSYAQCYPSNCGSANYSTTYLYDLAGDMTSLAETQVAGITLSYSYDGAARPTKVTSTLVDTQHPATLYTVDPSVGYFPSGSLRKATLANGLTETAMYNKRLQPCRSEINSSALSFAQCTDGVLSGSVLDFSYGYNLGTSDNGNIASWSAAGNQTFNRSYIYDSLNRLSTLSDTAAGQSCKGLSWTYDAWGNRTDQNVTSGSCNAFHAIVGTNNRFSSPYQYDAAGNMTFDGTHTYTYDAENRLIQVDGGASASYVYDAEGHRVRKNTASSWSEYVYDTSGNVLAEWKNTFGWVVAYVYVNGQLIAQYQNNTTYTMFRDHLGSARLLTNLDHSVYDSLDYAPFGEQIAGGTGTTHKFTGKERDSESGLDNFGARYNASTMGRFMSPDPIHIMMQKFTDPQQWNMYAYVRNNPLRLVDNNGKWPTDIHNQIIDKAFPGLSPSQRAILKSASSAMDGILNGGQSKGNAYQHSMRAPNESPATAKKDTQNFIKTDEHLAQVDQKTTPTNASDINDKSLYMFGNAAHTVADGTSPEHVDAQGNPLPWNPLSPSGVEAHVEGEATITPEQMNSAVTAVQQAFQDTYGQAAAQQATTPPSPPPCTPDKDKKCQ